MLGILLLTTLVAFVVGDEYTDQLNEKMSGNWVPVKIFPPVPIKRNPECYKTKNTILDDYCKCGAKLVPQLKRSNVLLTNQLPIILVETDEELRQGYNATCLCKDKDETSDTFGTFTPFPNHMMIRIVNDNYFLAYDKDYGSSKTGYAVLLAKERPTTAELNELISKTDYVKDEVGSVVCTKGMQATTENPTTPVSIDELMSIINRIKDTIMRIPKLRR